MWKKNGEYRSTSGGFDTYELRCAATTGNVGKRGYRVLLSGIEDTLTEADRIIFLNQACDSTLRKEGFLITTEGFGIKAIDVAFLSLIGDFSNRGFKAYDYRIICSEKITPLILTLLISFSPYCFFRRKTLISCL